MRRRETSGRNSVAFMNPTPAESTASPEANGPPLTAFHGESLRPSFLWRFLRIPFRIFCRTWIRLEISGQEHLRDDAGGVLLVNHQSFLDPLLVGVMFDRPVSYLARDSLLKVPVIGSILRRTRKNMTHFSSPRRRENTHGSWEWPRTRWQERTPRRSPAPGRT